MVALLAGFVPLDYLIDVVSIGTLTAFIVVSLGVLILRYRQPDLPRGFKVPGFPVTPILSIIACGWILSSLHWITWVVFACWVSVFIVFYLLYGRKHSVLGRMLAGEDVDADDAEMRCRWALACDGVRWSRSALRRRELREISLVRHDSDRRLCFA